MLPGNIDAQRGCLRICAMKRTHMPHRINRSLSRVRNYLLPIFLVYFILVLPACKGSGSRDNQQAAASPAAPVISAFTASPSSIAPGQSSQLAWTVSNADSLTLNGIATTGSGTNISPASTTTCTLVATNSIGSTTASVTITVGSQAVSYGDMKAADLGAGANQIGRAHV
jgi:hypothetical protein